MPNRLADETSPYLLQHAGNPVDWEPWDQRALDRAHAEDKPIFLSIGYSACHWCHVMEHESFENPGIAAVMNEHFVCIKVDREERPDLDHIYMTAVQAMTGRGGWPMSVFLTPELQPFYGGTYFPPKARMQMPGFDQVLRAVEDAWRNRRQTLVEQSRELTRHITALGENAASHANLNADALRGAEATLERVFDFQHGGFGAAPKFPHPMDLRLLLRSWRRTGRDEPLRLVEITLDRMAAGGIYDHLAGGFHRYSVDERWLVPHFEKMLYDNGLLALVYLEAWQATQRDLYRYVVEETLDWTLGEMQTPTGGFASALDADSDGVEGKFYVWTPDEVDAALGAERGRVFRYVYDVSPEGNFEEQNILNLPKSVAQCARILNRDEDELRAELAADRRLLLARRGERIRPGLDDKVLVGWNALMIDALARAGAALRIDRYVMAAQRSARFILDEMRGEDGRLWHAWREGRARFAAYLDDYAGLANALVSLYEADFDERWIDDAVGLIETVLARFSDSNAGGFYYTADNHERLIARHKDWQDSSTPSGNGLAATALVRLARLTGRRDLADAAEATLAAFAGPVRDAPMACGQLLLALDENLGPSAELAIVAQRAASEDLSHILAEFRRRYWPAASLAVRPATHQTPTLDALFVDKLSVDAGEPAMYVCQGFVCQAPAVGRAAISALLETNAPFAQVSDRP